MASLALEDFVDLGGCWLVGVWKGLVLGGCFDCSVACDGVTTVSWFLCVLAGAGFFIMLCSTQSEVAGMEFYLFRLWWHMTVSCLFSSTSLSLFQRPVWWYLISTLSPMSRWSGCVSFFASFASWVLLLSASSFLFSLGWCHFAQKAAALPRFQRWFPAYKSRAKSSRSTQSYKEYRARTGRLYYSLLFVMRRRLNGCLKEPIRSRMRKF